MGLFLLDQESGVVALGMQGIHGDGTPSEREGTQEVLELGDLVGLFGDLLLGENEAADPKKGAEQMNGLAGFCRTSPNGLPVDGQRFGGVRDLLCPEGHGLFEGPGIDSDDRPMEGRPGGGNVTLPGGRKEGAESFQKILLGGEVFRPLAQRHHVGAPGQDAGDEDPEEERQGMADAFLLARVGQGVETAPQSLGAFERKCLKRDGHGRISFQKRGVGRVPEDLRGVFGEETDPDGLGLVVAMVDAGLVPEPPGLSKAGPAGRLVAGAGKAGGIDEGLEKVDRMAVHGLPVGGKSPRRPGQGLRGQVPNPTGRKEEIAHIVGQIAQAPVLDLRRPTDETVPERSLQGGSGPSQKSHPFPFEKGDMAKGLAGHPSEGEIVVLAHERIPSGPLLGRHKTDLERGQITERKWRGNGRRVHEGCYSR